jgi:hypothetical protein
MSAAIIRIVAKTFANGGGTFRPESGASVTSGWAVGQVDDSAYVIDIDSAHGPEFLEAALEALIDYNEFIGTWIDADTGLLHVDPVSIIDNEEWALALGRARRQKAIYHLDTDTEVRLDVPQSTVATGRAAS